MVYDIAIIGAGVVGTQIARNFSKYDLKTVLLEKESDVAMGTTKANSGIVHAGFDCQSGTMMADLNVKGCRMMEEVATTLHVPYERTALWSSLSRKRKWRPSRSCMTVVSPTVSRKTNSRSSTVKNSWSSSPTSQTMLSEPSTLPPQASSPL